MPPSTYIARPREKPLRSLYPQGRGVVSEVGRTVDEVAEALQKGIRTSAKTARPCPESWIEDMRLLIDEVDKRRDELHNRKAATFKNFSAALARVHRMTEVETIRVVGRYPDWIVHQDTETIAGSIRALAADGGYVGVHALGDFHKCYESKRGALPHPFSPDYDIRADSVVTFRLFPDGYTLPMKVTIREKAEREVHVPFTPLEVVVYVQKTMPPGPVRARVPHSGGMIAGSYIHPHVSATGQLCLGEAARGLRNFQRTGDFCVLHDVLSSVLGTYNRMSPYYSIRRFSTLYRALEAGCAHCGYSAVGSMTKEMIDEIIATEGKFLCTHPAVIASEPRPCTECTHLVCKRCRTPVPCVPGKCAPEVCRNCAGNKCHCRTTALPSHDCSTRGHYVVPSCALCGRVLCSEHYNRAVVNRKAFWHSLSLTRVAPFRHTACEDCITKLRAVYDGHKVIMRSIAKTPYPTPFENLFVPTYKYLPRK